MSDVVSFTLQVDQTRITAASQAFTNLVPHIVGSEVLSRFTITDSTESISAGSQIALKEDQRISFTVLAVNQIDQVKQLSCLPHVQALSRLMQRGISVEDLNEQDPIRDYWNELNRNQAVADQRDRDLQNAERMVSLGTLAAGVAHEINNPLAFIKSNLMSLEGFLKPMVDTVKSLLAIAENSPQLLQQLEAQGLTYDEEELSFILGDLDDILVDLRDGSERIVTIVSGLKQYSHPSRQAPVPTDINDVIRVAIELSRNEFKYHAKLETDLTDIPPIKANAGELTQVLVNLLVNAAQAIPEHGRIWVRSAQVCHQGQQVVEIRVGDTGTGMSAELIEKIFDPFYTTKEVGKGTGLGLSISQRIVNEHGGEIEVHSQPNEGTEFILRFPLSLSATNTQS